jgi:hypothetical protein
MGNVGSLWDEEKKLPKNPGESGLEIIKGKARS